MNHKGGITYAFQTLFALPCFEIDIILNAQLTHECTQIHSSVYIKCLYKLISPAIVTDVHRQITT